MKKQIAAIAALAGVIGIAGTAQAGHDDNPSAKVASYHYELGAVQPDTVPGSRAHGTTRVMALPNGKVQVTVEAWGLAPDIPHAMHLHGVPGDAPDMGCPGPGQAGDDGVVTVVDGIPFYGGILASLTTSGDTAPGSALALDRMPVADSAGHLSYQRTFRNEAAFADAGTVQVVVHGIDFDGSGGYAYNADDPFASRPSSLNAVLGVDVPLEATAPVLCGGIAN